MAGALQPDEFGHILEVLRKDILLTQRDHRDRPHAERKKLVAAASVVSDVDCVERDAFFRKKLFRSEAATSTGLGEEDELFVCAHGGGQGKGKCRLYRRIGGVKER